MKMRPCIGLLALVACQSSPTISGQPMGSFSFSATPVTTDCPFVAVPMLNPDAGSFTFDAIISREPDNSKAYLRIGNVERSATFDGQVLVSEKSAPRHFDECNCDKTAVDESLRVALLSTTQDAALGHACPPNPLDGGVVPPNPDGGILPPCPTSASCDVSRACGELSDVVLPDVSCQCATCSALFQVEGQRKAESR